MADMVDFPRWVAEQGALAAAWAAALEPGQVDPSCLLAMIGQVERFSRHLEGMKARLAADAVRRDAWWSTGARDPYTWYAGVTGTSVGAAHRVLDTEERLKEQPDLAAARQKGELSEEQTALISSAAGDDAAAQQQLMHRARTTTARQLRQECDRTRAARRSREDEERRLREMHEARSLRFWTDASGAGCHAGTTTPDAQAELLAHLEPFERAEFDRARQEGRRESPSAYRADALLAMARAATANRTATADSEKRVGLPATVIVLVDHAALVRGHTEGEETCHIEGVGQVPVSMAKAMMHDAFLAAVVTDGTDIRSVAHLGRQVTARQWHALITRDRCCVVPGCGSTHHLEIDHVTGWKPTHHTTVDELARLCARHHRMKTYQGWQLNGPPGHWNWTGPDDPDRPPPPTSTRSAGPDPGQQGDLFATAGTDPP